MKTILILGAVGVILLTGCVGIAIGRRWSPPTPPAVESTAAVATIAEIDAAARLSFDNPKIACLKQIAQRRELPSVAQVHLVNVSYACLSFDNQKVELLRTVIAHRDFSDDARHAIVSQLSKLAFDNQQRDILRLINQRVSAL